MDFKTNLRQIRQEHNKTQRDVANILCVSETCYAHWEQGRSEPSIANLKKLCEIFDIKVGELLGFEDEFGNKL